MYGSGFPKHRAALKPAFEPIVFARKPFKGSLDSNEAEYGTGALNIDACRIEGEPWKAHEATGLGSVKFFTEGDTPVIHKEPHAGGRWPANVALDEYAADVLDEQAGTLKSGARKPGTYAGLGYNGSPSADFPGVQGSEGGASRFFYVAKAPTKERPKVDGVSHPTVKPVALMRWLVKLVTPPGGVILDPFLGSGTTAQAALEEGFRCIGMEMTEEYLPLIHRRLGALSQSAA
jgi:site-specific DNA-methyltransferase (adenine-specific)